MVRAVLAIGGVFWASQVIAEGIDLNPVFGQDVARIEVDGDSLDGELWDLEISYNRGQQLGAAYNNAYRHLLSLGCTYSGRGRDMKLDCNGVKQGTSYQTLIKAMADVVNRAIELGNSGSASRQTVDKLKSVIRSTKVLYWSATVNSWLQTIPKFGCIFEQDPKKRNAILLNCEKLYQTPSLIGDEPTVDQLIGILKQLIKVARLGARDDSITYKQKKTFHTIAFRAEEEIKEIRIKHLAAKYSPKKPSDPKKPVKVLKPKVPAKPNVPAKPKKGPTRPW